MQPLAIGALVAGAVMVIGVTVTLILTRHGGRPRRAGISRWQLHGSVPLAGAGLALGAMSRGGGQSPATHDVIFGTATALLLGALPCALAGAVTETWQQRIAR